MSTWVQPTKANLTTCTVGGMPFTDGQKNNFHVQEMRIFEDHCKPYFTGQLVIEAHQNTWELYVTPGAGVEIAFTAPRSDGGPTKDYSESFRILSYESRPREGDILNAMVITLNLIGQEYYDDRDNVVLRAYSNIPGTAAAAAIHEEYMAENGGLQVPIPSLGMIGMDKVPHQVNNKKPIKAIHDLLDKSVFAGYPSCAPTYFRNKYGYVIAPLQYLLENAPVAQSFMHWPSEGIDLKNVLMGYDKIIHLRPMAPPGPDPGVNSQTMDMLSAAQAFFDVRKGDFLNNFQSLGNIAQGLTSGFQGVVSSFQGAVKSKYGGRQMMNMIDSFHQPPAISKDGPGNWQAAQASFLTALGFVPKYWISVPLQTGVNVTCGERINAIYPVSDQDLIAKTMYVPRLIHELKFTEGRNRKPVTVIGTTDIFCVAWGN